MAATTGHEGNYPPADPEAAAIEPVTAEPMPASKIESEPSSTDMEKSLPLDATRVATQASVTSALTMDPESESPDSETDKPWYQRLNPVKQKKIPVPKERTVSREYGASFLSLLTFQWMAPIMKVSVSFRVCEVGLGWKLKSEPRLDTNDHWNSMTSGWFTRIEELGNSPKS